MIFKENEFVLKKNVFFTNNIRHNVSIGGGAFFAQQRFFFLNLHTKKINKHKVAPHTFIGQI